MTVKTKWVVTVKVEIDPRCVDEGFDSVSAVEFVGLTLEGTTAKVEIPDGVYKGQETEINPFRVLDIEAEEVLENGR